MAGEARAPVKAAGGGATSSSPAAPAVHPRLVLATCILASSLAFVDGSVVNVGLTAIRRAFSAGAAELQWVVDAYLLLLSTLLLLGGAAGDRFGRRRLLIAGTSLFALASAGCALAPGLGALIACRLVQGAGAALLLPNSLAILSATFTGKARGGAIGVWSACGAAMGALGPVLGGALIDSVGWRAIFLLNLPLALAAILMAWRVVPKDKRAGDRPIDATGAALATLGLGALTWSLTIGAGRSGWTPAAVTMAASALGLLAAFALVERRRGERAMLPLALFSSRSFIGLTLLTILLYGALGGLLVLLPFTLINAAHYTATEAGASLLPIPLVLSVASPAMGALAGRIGPRWPLTLGPLGVAAGFALMLRIGPAADYWTQVLPAVLVMAAGMSGAVAPLTTAVLNSVDDQHAGSASGFNSAAARTGGLIATALLGTVLAAPGSGLPAAFHAAMLASVFACGLASLSAGVLIGREVQSSGAHGQRG